ncbi:unnamed protein product [Mytilus edulis]|uniref:Uncharacterized protein n=1 Tax=Mytilus edulis TaxID=6550 RepID=A0A8S3V4Q9_MYTED|nr:unnamed protein product [Mytilus edulis]
MKLLTNRRLVRFADVGTENSIISFSPYCFCITEDDSLIVYLWSSNLYQMYGGYQNRIMWMNTDGIMTKSFYFNDKTWNQPCSIQNLESGICVLYRIDNNSNLHGIDLIDATSKTYNKLLDFKGVYGSNPKQNFECEGICVDKAHNIFVSDVRHHSVYILDKHLKYKHTLFNAKNGLDTPAAIGLLNDYIWVADGNNIYIFHNT